MGPTLVVPDDVDEMITYFQVNGVMYYVDPYGKKNASDNVSAPSHYTASNIECIDYLEDNLGPGFEYFLEGNVKKYLHRFRLKHSEIEDLRKARWYLDRLISHISQED